MTASTKSAKPARRMARTATSTAAIAVIAKGPTKLDQIAGLLAQGKGASIAEIMAATGWQQHSVRGAMAGALKKRGLVITSHKEANVRRYRAGAA